MRTGNVYLPSLPAGFHTSPHPAHAYYIFLCLLHLSSRLGDKSKHRFCSSSKKLNFQVYFLPFLSLLLPALLLNAKQGCSPTIQPLHPQLSLSSQAFTAHMELREVYKIQTAPSPKHHSASPLEI